LPNTGCSSFETFRTGNYSLARPAGGGRSQAYHGRRQPFLPLPQNSSQARTGVDIAISTERGPRGDARQIKVFDWHRSRRCCRHVLCQPCEQAKMDEIATCESRRLSGKDGQPSRDFAAWKKGNHQPGSDAAQAVRQSACQIKFGRRVIPEGASRLQL
jgi:hypothetical protein